MPGTSTASFSEILELLQDFVGGWDRRSHAPGIRNTEVFLNANLELGAATSINGYVVDLGAEHSIAIYDRNGEAWVAEFEDGRGELMNANAWYYFHAARLGYWRRRNPLEPPKPLTPDIVAEIERLHERSEARPLASAARRCRSTLAQAAARLNRAVEIHDDANDSKRPGKDPLLRSTFAAAAQRATGLVSWLRGLGSKVSRTPG